MIFIIAGNYRQAQEIALHENLRPAQWRYVEQNNYYRLQGYTEYDIIWGGTYYDRSDYLSNKLQAELYHYKTVGKTFTERVSDW